MALPPTGSRAVDEMQVKLFRAAGTGRRARLAFSLSSSVIRMARAGIRRRHPEYSEEEVLLKFVSVHYGSDLADRVRRRLHRKANG